MRIIYEMISISVMVEKIKKLTNLRPVLRELKDDLFLGTIIILVAFGSFGLGRLSKIEGARTPIQIENAPEITPETFTNGTQAASVQNAVAQPDTNTVQLVGSKTGNKYHYTWCSGAKRIAEANRRYFSSKADAEAQGYTPASNCKGL